ncbi:unnamed protein product, partial [Arabidopsis halleri]
KDKEEKKCLVKRGRADSYKGPKQKREEEKKCLVKSVFFAFTCSRNPNSPRFNVPHWPLPSSSHSFLVKHSSKYES